MTDQAFERILAGQLRQYAEAGVRPIDRYAIASATIASGRTTRRWRLSLPWGRAVLVPIIVGLLLLAIVASVLIVGSRLRNEDRTHHLVTVSGSPASPQPGGVQAIDTSCLALDELDVDTGRSQRLADCSDGLLVSPNGAHAAEAGPDGLTIVDLRTGRRSLTGDTLGTYPRAWSPGGRWLRWATCATDTKPCDSVIGEPGNGDRQRLPIQIVGGPSASLGWSLDDRRAFIRDGSSVFVGDGDGSNLVPIGTDQGWFALSPDGQRIAYGAGTNPFPGGAARAFDVYVADADGSGGRNVTEFDSESAYGAAWSPNGRTLVVVSSAPRLAGTTSVDPAQLWLVDLAGPKRRVDLPTEILQAPARDWSATIKWSPGGSWFAFESVPIGTAGPIDVVLVPQIGTGVVVVPDARLPAWSGDGGSLAIVGGFAAPRLEVLNADGSGRRVVGTTSKERVSQLVWAR